MVVYKNTNRLISTIRPFVEELFTSGYFSQEDLEIVSPSSGLPTKELMDSDGGVCDRFKLVLPFAGYSVVWEVIFDGTCPHAAPDFIFDDELFLCNCDLNSIPSLISWDPSNGKAFVHVMSDLLKLYSKYQLQQAGKTVGPTILKWLDFENVMNSGFKIEILNGGQKSSPYSSLSRHGKSLQYGTTSVLVEVPFTSDLVASTNMQFSIQYIFKSHSTLYEEKINCSPELEGWIRPWLDMFKKKNRWIWDSGSLSAAIESVTKDIDQMFNRSVQEFTKRQNLLFSLHHNIMTNADLNPILLEFDFREFQFSSYLLQDKRLFYVEFMKSAVRGRVLAVNNDCQHKSLFEVYERQLTDPKFNIESLLTRYNSC